MGAIPSRAQSEFYKGLLPIELTADAPAVFTADVKNDRFAGGQPSPSEETSRPLSSILISFCIGVAATLTWQSYSDAARQIIATWSPQLGWLAPQAFAPQITPNTVEQLITRIADRIVTSIAATQEPIVRTVDQLTAGQEDLTREIIKLEAISQYSLSKDLESQPRPVHVRTLKPGTRAVR
jgi:hypothetical protein